MGGPIHIGADPRWYEYQNQRKDAAMADILQALQYRQQREDQRNAQTAELFFKNPSLIGTDAWTDWSAKAGAQYGDLIGIGNELALQNQRAAQASAETWRDVFNRAAPQNAEQSISMADPPMRDEPGDLFAFTGIQPGTGPLAPEFWPENAPASQAPGVRIPENPFVGAMLGADVETINRMAPLFLKELGADLVAQGNPGVINALQPDVRNYGALLNSNPQLAEEMGGALKLATGAEMTAAQQAQNALGLQRHEWDTQIERERLEEQERHNRTTEGLTRSRDAQSAARAAEKDAFKFDPKDYAAELTGGFETAYDDEGKPLPEGMQGGIDKSTATRIGTLVSQTVAGLPPKQQQAASQKSVEQFRSAFGYFMDDAKAYFGGLSPSPEGEDDGSLTGGDSAPSTALELKAKVRAQKALLFYARELQKIQKLARSREEGNELRLAAFNKAREQAGWSGE